MDKIQQQINELLATGEVDEESLRIHLESAEKIRERFLEAVLLQRHRILAEYGDDLLDTSGAKDCAFLTLIAQRELGEIANLIISDSPNIKGRADSARALCVQASATLLALTELLTVFPREDEAQVA